MCTARLIATYSHAQTQDCDCYIHYVLSKKGVNIYAINYFISDILSNYFENASNGKSCTENKKYTLISQQSFVNNTDHLFWDIFCLLKNVFVFYKQENVLLPFTSPFVSALDLYLATSQQYCC